jgi:uncharacterized protein YkwD
MHRATRTRAVLLVSLVSMLALVAASPDASARTTDRKHQLRRVHMLHLMNSKRDNRGIRNLDMNHRLARQAKRHSRKMAADGYIYHTTDLTDELRSVSWSIAGENVGAGWDVDGLFKAFMDSAPHRRNILRTSFKHVGIGMVSRDNTLWVTMVFYG